MRVTNRQFVNLVARNVNISSQRLLKAQERLATMKRINRPSDDPIGMNRVLEYRRKVASAEQYIRNIDTATIRVEATVCNLEDVHELLRQARDIAASQASANDPTGRITAARQIANIHDQVRDIANTRLGGSYLFAGHATDTRPFPKDKGEIYEADSGSIETIVGEGIRIKINAHGNEVFTGSGVADGVNVFAALKEVKTALESPDFDAPSLAQAAEDLGKAVSQVETVVSEQSTTFKRLEQTREYWNHMKQKFEDVLSKTGDADAAQLAVELQAEETAYEMALASASNVLKRNLMDFLA